MTIEARNLKEYVSPRVEEAAIRTLFQGMQLQVEILIVTGGQFVTPRSTALADTYLQVLDGEGVFELGSEVLVLTRHMTLLVPPGETVGMINEGDQALIVLRVTAPPE